MGTEHVTGQCPPRTGAAAARVGNDPGRMNLQAVRVALPDRLAEPLITPVCRTALTCRSPSQLKQLLCRQAQFPGQRRGRSGRRNRPAGLECHLDGRARRPRSGSELGLGRPLVGQSVRQPLAQLRERRFTLIVSPGHMDRRPCVFNGASYPGAPILAATAFAATLTLTAAVTGVDRASAEYARSTMAPSRSYAGTV